MGRFIKELGGNLDSALQSTPEADDNAPEDFNGKPIRFKIDSVESSIEFARRSTKLLEDVPRIKSNLQRRVILGSAVALEADGANSLKFMSQSAPEAASGENLARWLHVQSELMDFKYFQERAVHELRNSSDAVKATVLSLFKRVKLYEKPFVHGQYIEMGTVLRCDLEDPKDVRKDVSAMFVCFPYLALGQSKALPASASGLHPPRSLLQCLYDHESAEDRDAEHSFARFDKRLSQRLLEVHQIWVLIVNSDFIVTCSPMPIDDCLTSDGIEVEPMNSSSVVIHIKDVYNRSFFVKSDRCRTFLLLAQYIIDECLMDTDASLDDCQLFITGDSNELVATKWPEILSSTKSGFINIMVKRRDVSSPEHDLAVHEPQTLATSSEGTYLIDHQSVTQDEDTSASSEAESELSTATEKGQLILAQENSSIVARQTHQNQKKRDLAAQLRREGFVINSLASVFRNDPTSTLTARRTHDASEVVYLTRGPRTVSNVEFRLPNGFGKPKRKRRDNPAYSEAKNKAEQVSPQEEHPVGYEDKDNAGPSSGVSLPPMLDLASVPLSYELADEDLPVIAEGQVKPTPQDALHGTNVSEELAAKASGLSLRGSPVKAAIEESEFVPAPYASDTPSTTSLDMSEPHTDTRSASNGSGLSGDDENTGKHDRLERARVTAESVQLAERISDAQSSQISLNLENAYSGGKSEGPYSRETEDWRRMQEDIVLLKLELKLLKNKLGEKEERPRPEEFEGKVNEETRDFSAYTAPLHLKPVMDRGEREGLDEELERSPGELSEQKKDKTLTIADFLDEMKEEENRRVNHEMFMLSELRREQNEAKEREWRKEAELKRRYIEMQAQQKAALESFMQKRMAPFGYTESQVRSIVYDEPPPPGQPPPAPLGFVARTYNPPPPPPPPPKHFIVEPTGPSLPERKRQGAGQANEQMDYERETTYFPNVDAPADPKLEVSPFLTWAKDISAYLQKGHDEQMDDQDHEPEVRSLRMTLNMVTKNLSRNTLAGLPSSNCLSEEYKKGQLYTAVPEKGPEDVDMSEISLLKSKWAISPHSKDDQQTKLPTYDLLERWHINKIVMYLADIMSISQELLECFIGQYVDSPAIKKYYGSLSTILSTIKTIEKDAVSRTESETKDEGKSWVVQDISVEEGFMQFHKLRAPPVPVSGCYGCLGNHSVLPAMFNNREDGITHLEEKHFRHPDASHNHGPNQSIVSTEELQLWLHSKRQFEIGKRDIFLCKILKQISATLRQLRNVAVQIRHAVADNTKQKSNKFNLPKSLVKTAEHIITLVLVSGRTVESIHKIFMAWKRESDHQNYQRMETLVEDYSGAIQFFGQRAEISLNGAQDDLALMARVGAEADSTLTYMASGPELQVIAMLITLVSRPIDGMRNPDLSVQDHFRMYIARLRNEVRKDPRKRVFRDLYMLKEELDAMLTVIDRQGWAMSSLYQNLDSDSYRVVTPVRNLAFKTEKDVLLQFQDFLLSLMKKTERLREQADEVAESTRLGIDIQDEANNKALMVFTTVTLIFLPLSFVATVFGMNTNDIRNLDKNQWIFWAFAIPLTLIVIVVSLVVAFKGSDLKRSSIDIYFNARNALSQLRTPRLPIWEPQPLQPDDLQGNSGQLRRRETLNSGQFRVKNMKNRRKSWA